MAKHKHTKFEIVWIVMRRDSFYENDRGHYSQRTYHTAVGVHNCESTALDEVARLNNLSGAKTSDYYMLQSRLYNSCKCK